MILQLLSMEIVLANGRCYELEIYSMICQGAKRAGLKVVTWDFRKGELPRSSGLFVFNALSLDKYTLYYANGQNPRTIFFERNPFFIEGDDVPGFFHDLFRICRGSISYVHSFLFCSKTVRGRFQELQLTYRIRPYTPWNHTKDGKIYIFPNYNEGFWTKLMTKDDLERTKNAPNTPWYESTCHLINTALQSSDRDVMIKFHPLTNRDRADYQYLESQFGHHPRINFLHGNHPYTTLVYDMYCALLENGSSCIPLLLLGVPTVNPRKDFYQTWFSKICVNDTFALHCRKTLYSLVPNQEDALDFVASQTWGRKEIKAGVFFSYILSHEPEGLSVVPVKKDIRCEDSVPALPYSADPGLPSR